MIPDASDRELDALLSEWSRARDAEPARLDGLRQRIVAAACDTFGQIGRDNEPPTIARANRPPIRAVRYALATISLALLVVAFGRIWLGETPVVTPDSRLIAQMPQPPAALLPDFAWLRRDQIAAKFQLLQELKRMFGERVEWLAEAGDHFEFKLADETEVREASERPVAVRLVVQRRSGDTWQVAWELDIVTHEERVTRLPFHPTLGAEVDVWAHRLPDGLIHLESHIRAPDRDGLHVDSASVLTEGVPHMMANEVAHDDEYRVFELVASLSPDLS